MHEVDVPDNFKLDPDSLDYGPDECPNDPEGYRRAVEHDRVEAYFLSLPPDELRRLPVRVLERHVDLGDWISTEASE